MYIKKLNTKLDDLKVKVNKENKANKERGNDFMYITETSKNVFDLFEKFEKLDDLERLNVCIILSEEWSNKLINERNEINPTTTDEDFEIFSPSSLGIEEYFGHLIATEFYAIKINALKCEDDVIDDNYLNMKLTEIEKNWLLSFEKLLFEEKIDIISEMLIRYDNDTLFEEIKDYPAFGDDIELNGYNIASEIKEYKKH